MTMAMHMSVSNEHYTPLDVIEAARSVMGGIDLDPATSDSVNEHRVKAARHFTIHDDGLQRVWRGRTWLNPPGGVMSNGRSRAAVFWEKLVDEYLDGRVTQAIFLGFSTEIFASSQDARMWVGGVPFCVPRARLRYDREVSPGVFQTSEQPTHAGVVAYLPPRGESVVFDHPGVVRFIDHFEKYGKITVPR